jgi:hypothetical protein
MTGAMPGAPGDDCGGVLAAGRLADRAPMRGRDQLEDSARLGLDLEASRGQDRSECHQVNVLWDDDDHGRYSQIG